MAKTRIELNIKNKVEAINSWQSNRELHPYTCPICQQKLFPAINKKVILNCECGYQQAVPKAMLKRYKKIKKKEGKV